MSKSGVFWGHNPRAFTRALPWTRWGLTVSPPPDPYLPLIKPTLREKASFRSAQFHLTHHEHSMEKKWSYNFHGNFLSLGSCLSTRIDVLGAYPRASIRILSWTHWGLTASPPPDPYLPFNKPASREKAFSRSVQFHLTHHEHFMEKNDHIISAEIFFPWDHVCRPE